MADKAPFERGIEWAVKVFRPLLKDLSISTLSNTENFRQILTAGYKEFIRHHMDNCVVLVCRHNLTKEEYQGIFVLRYSREENFYALYIILNDNLFSPEKKVIRKAVSIHEYVHCVAAMLALSRLATERLLEKFQKKMSERFPALTVIDTNNILNDLKKSKNIQTLDTFDDNHFRIEWEDFQASYADLYRNLLLSYELFCEKGFFDTEKQKQFNKYIQDGKGKDAGRILGRVINDLAEIKHLDYDFVYNRLMGDFLLKILNSIS